jgi:hypothetical protein
LLRCCEIEPSNKEKCLEKLQKRQLLAGSHGGGSTVGQERQAQFITLALCNRRAGRAPHPNLNILTRWTNIFVFVDDKVKKVILIIFVFV